MSSQPETLTTPYRDVAGYFKGLSTAYGRQTGDATYNVALSFFSKLSKAELSSATVIHDNACGVGTASFALLAAADDNTPRRIEATDSSQPMISSLEAQIAKSNLDFIHPILADSHALPFEDNTFDVSITNVSITNCSDAPQALREIRRTLKPHSLAVVSIWKRFTVSEVIHEAQRSIKASAAVLMPVPQREFFEDNYLRDKMIEAGFKHVHQTCETTKIEGLALDGLREFMVGPLTKVARNGWTDEEEARWGNAIDEAIERESNARGGFSMDVWFVTATK